MRATYFILAFVLLTAHVGCQQKMADQPSFKPLEASDFFTDERSARPVVAGTVARGHLRTDVAFFTGRIQTSNQATPAATTSSIEAQPGSPPASSSPTDGVEPSGSGPLA